MRTTLEIDNDVLDIARSIALQQQTTMGRVISDMARKSLTSATSATTRNGLRVLARPGQSVPVTLAIVNRLRDERP